MFFIVFLFFGVFSRFFVFCGFLELLCGFSGVASVWENKSWEYKAEKLEKHEKAHYQGPLFCKTKDCRQPAFVLKVV